MKIKFKEYFSSVILKRGYEYYAESLVKELKITNDHIFAVVEGNDDYYVRINIDNEKLVEADCSCPYAMGYDQYCKHMAAVLFEVTEEQQTDVENDEGYNILNMVEKVGYEKLKDSVIKQISKDNKLKDSFIKEFYSKETDFDYKVMVGLEVSRIAGYNGYIDYYKGDEYVNAMIDFLQDASDLIENEEYLKAFNLVIAILEQIPETAIDGSSGEISIVTGNCDEAIGYILLECFRNKDKNEKTLRTIFEYIMSEIKTSYLDDYGIDIITWLEDYINNKLYFNEIENVLIEKIKASEERSYSKTYILTLLMRIYQLTNQENKLLKIYQDNLGNEEIFLKYIDDYLISKDLKQAIKLLQEKVVEEGLRNNHPVFRSYPFSDKLLEIYQSNNMVTEFKDELYKGFFSYRLYDFQLYSKIKKLFKLDGWKNEFEKILELINEDAKSNYESDVMKIYIEEKMYDKIFENIKNLDHRYIIKRYEKYLLPKYNDNLLEIYIDLLLKEVSLANTRKKYWSVANDIKKLKRFENSKEKIRKLIERIKELYSNKPALREELDKVIPK